jgi:mono/diheme cytochrome c family protein
MPWNESSVEDERIHFVARPLRTEKVAFLRPKFARSQTKAAFAGYCALIGVSSLAMLAHASMPAPMPSPRQPTFARDIAPILYRQCATCHHSNQPGALCGTDAFPLLSYQDAKKHAVEIAAVTRTRLMPPWLPEAGYGDFAGEHRLTEAQIQLISKWVRGGEAEGPASEIPSAPQFSEGWQLGPPDLVLEAARGITVPATGPDLFWNFIFSTSPWVKTTRYVRAIEVRPGNDGSLVHHANVILDPERSARRQESEPGAGFPGMDILLEHSPLDIPGHFLFWKPGGAPWVEPEGLAWRLDPGTDLVLNAHFMPIGTPQLTKPSIGLYFADKPPDRFPMLIELENDQALDIPAGAPNFSVSDDFRLPRDVDVLAVYPHAHYLGHLLEGYATLPNGQRKWLIRITDWNPNWQAVYHYREPVFLPKGTVISMRYRYDNSSTNPRNPNSPPRRVLGGNRSADEMAHFWLQVLPRGTDAGREDGRVEIQSELLEHRMDKYRDDIDARISLGALRLARYDPAGAVAVLQQAVRLDPKQEEARRFLGAALDAIGRSPEAIVQYRRAVELKPDDMQARYALARALVKSGRFDEALEHFRKVAAADPQNASLCDEFGELLMQQGQPASALKQFNAALALDPSQKTAQRDRRVALDQLQKR